MVDSLLSAALARHPTTRELQGARRAITAVRAFPPEELVDPNRKTVRRGKFSRGDGVLYLATQRPDGTPLPPEVVAGVLVHEVAHAATAGSHSAEWRDMYLALLRVATEDLGWKVALECSSCKFYGVCHEYQCPRCAWVQCRQIMTR